MTKKQNPEDRIEEACSSQPTQEQLDAIGEGVQGLGFWGNAGKPDDPVVEFSQLSDPSSFEPELILRDGDIVQSTDGIHWEVTSKHTEEPWAHLPAKLGDDGGRPSTYRPKLFWDIMQQLRIAKPLSVAADDYGTSDDRVRKWMLLDESGELSAEYARARDRGWDRLAMDVLEIADTAAGDMIDTKDGPRISLEVVQRSKLRIWARMELLKRWDPRRYGEMLKLTGDRDNPVSLESRTTLSDEQLAQIASRALK